MTKQRIALIFAALCGLGLILTVVDLWRDPDPLTFLDATVSFADELLLLASMAGVAWVVHRLRDVEETQTALTNNVARAVAQGEQWRVARQGEIAALSHAIEDQFRAWRLSAAEIDIAGLMLKGASLKEIALARDTSEATIRQQAQSIYRKSGLTGRAELSAYFLESLFAVADDARGPGLTVVPGSPRG